MSDFNHMVFDIETGNAVGAFRTKMEALKLVESDSTLFYMEPKSDASLALRKIIKQSRFADAWFALPLITDVIEAAEKVICQSVAAFAHYSVQLQSSEPCGECDHCKILDSIKKLSEYFDNE